jgi:hypothetical protein
MNNNSETNDESDVDSNDSDQSDDLELESDDEKVNKKNKQKEKIRQDIKGVNYFEGNDNKTKSRKKDDILDSIKAELNSAFEEN